MRGTRTALFLLPLLAAACAGNPDRRTLATLHKAEPDVTEVQIENGLEQAMMGYRKFLEEAPRSSLTPEAMRRLADLQLEKEYGVLGHSPAATPAPMADVPAAPDRGATPIAPPVGEKVRCCGAIKENRRNPAADVTPSWTTMESSGSPAITA